MKFSKTLNIKLSLNTLTQQRKDEKWGKSEPYLWNIFFKADGKSIKVLNDFSLGGAVDFHFSEGSHNNLKTSIHEKSMLKIPAEIGAWNTKLTPIRVAHQDQKVPGVIGVISILMEQNNVTDEGAEAGRIALNKKVEEMLNQALPDFDPKDMNVDDIQSSISQYFKKKVDEFAKELRVAVVKAITNKQSFLQNIWSRINADNMVGFHVWTFGHDDLLDAKDNVLFLSHRWNSDDYGDWEIMGKISLVSEF